MDETSPRRAFTFAAAVTRVAVIALCFGHGMNAYSRLSRGEVRLGVVLVAISIVGISLGIASLVRRAVDDSALTALTWTAFFAATAIDGFARPLLFGSLMGAVGTLGVTVTLFQAGRDVFKR
jgi:hypothetical protein